MVYRKFNISLASAMNSEQLSVCLSVINIYPSARELYTPSPQAEGWSSFFLQAVRLLRRPLDVVDHSALGAQVIYLLLASLGNTFHYFILYFHLISIYRTTLLTEPRC